jgi:transposase InsO family protein
VSAPTERWYICVVIDLASRRVIAWRYAESPDANLVVSTLQVAFRERLPAPGLVLHSDRGGEYANRRVSALLEKHSAFQSMSRRGNCWDNAVAESFFATLKRECVYLLGHDADMFSEIDGYIRWFNDSRLHSTIGYRSPRQFEESEFGIKQN